MLLKTWINKLLPQTTIRGTRIKNRLQIQGSILISNWNETTLM